MSMANNAMIKKLVLLLLVTVCKLAVYADGYWLELKGSGKTGDTLSIRIRYGGVDDDSRRYLKTGKELDKMAGIHLFVINAEGKRTDVVIKQLQDCWEGLFIPVSAGSYQVLAYMDQLPVVERPDSMQNIRPIQYCCALYTVGNGAGNIVPHQFLDIVATQKGDAVVIRAYIDRQPVTAGTKLRIFNPQNWEKLPVTDKNGEARFIPVTKGLYIIRLDVNDNKPSTFKTKRYQAIRHRCDYTIFIE